MLGIVVLVFGGVVAVRASRRNDRRGLRTGFIVMGAGAVLVALLAGVPADGEVQARSLGLSHAQVERECLARVEQDLVSPSSMEFLGNPVGAEAFWDGAESEWRWIMDVSAVNAFNVRMRARYQCIVRAGPTYTVLRVDN